jgi:peptidyl-dipeptidase A
LKPLTARSLAVAQMAFKNNQMPKEMLEKKTSLYAELTQIRQGFRAALGGEKYSNRDLRVALEKETDTPKRQKIWEALNQVGNAVASKLIALAELRNESARKLGYKDFWDMSIRLQEYNPAELITIFTELETYTNQPYKQMKAKMDTELAEHFKIKVEELMPWHYGNPLFQLAPSFEKIDLDEFYKDKKKEDIIRIARRFFNDIGLSIEGIAARSDLYAREGKYQSAYSFDINLNGDTRVLLNLEPTVGWMHAALHELGHALYYDGINRRLPVNLRDAAHPFTTEAVAMFFGALAKNPAWLVTYVNADPGRVKEVEEIILEQRRREQLIFARWTLVMFHFEKAFYQNPHRDLNRLWWDLVERFQLLKRPRERDRQGYAHWAVKGHLASHPIYYHNYMMGELLAAQLRAALVKLTKHNGPASTLKYEGQKEIGEFLKEKIFKPGMSEPWPEFVKNAFGEPLTAKYFTEELKML